VARKENTVQGEREREDRSTGNIKVEKKKEKMMTVTAKAG